MKSGNPGESVTLEIDANNIFRLDAETKKLIPRYPAPASHVQNLEIPRIQRNVIKGVYNGTFQRDCLEQNTAIDS